MKEKCIYIARDKDPRRLLIFFEVPPYKDEENGRWLVDDEEYDLDQSVVGCDNPDLYPEVTWENSPKKLIIEGG